MKGRILKQGAVWTNSMSVERQQGEAYQADLFDEALLKALRHGGLARIKWRDIYSVLAMSTSNATGER